MTTTTAAAAAVRVPSLVASDVALAVTAAVTGSVGAALQLRPAETLALYTQQDHSRSVALDLARVAGWGLFAVAVLAATMLSVRHAEARATLGYALSYVFFFAAAVHALQAYVDHGSWLVALARSPVEPLSVLYARLYVPAALAALNFIAAWCDDVVADDEPSPPPPPLPPKSDKKTA